MPDLNPQLQAAIARSDLTPEQQAQLQLTIAQDPPLLARLNADADNKSLGNFTLSTPGSLNLVGSYDGSTVTLPTNSFDSGGAGLDATLRIQSMSMRFSHAVDPATKRQVPSEVVHNLQSVLNGSPVLAEQMRHAVTPPVPGQRALLEDFRPLSGTHAGGQYNGDMRTIDLPLTSLTQLGKDANFNERDLTFVLGHELQHSFTDPCTK